MTKNVHYTFVANEGNLVFRSSVNSFGLDHVTDKDIMSFYTKFSSFAYMDTGLLPVDGSGLLSLRTAGNHTQIAYQHAPGMYYINWGDHEGDAGAVKYYVAQPYRIVIADLLNGNIYGARTFYSPVPITHPDIPLYHVNLPNINCRGYRGNGVGWICLYHSEDITHYPFNEKLAKVLDRCSGTEAYNDANMSETDGPRFYRDFKKPSYLWDPVQWQEYSQINGVAWTLDSDLWIPILVQDMDNQDKHYDNGQPLTFVQAILGNYKCYYYDETIPKPVNALVRPDLTLDSSQVFNWFKLAYNSSSSVDLFKKDNPYSNTLTIREQQSVAPPVFIADENENEDGDPAWYCEDCENNMSDDDSPHSTYHSNFICDSCFENYTYCENTNNYHPDDNVLYLTASDLHIHPDHSQYYVDYKWCSSCDVGFYKTHTEFETVQFHQDDTICMECYNEAQQQESDESSPF